MKIKYIFLIYLLINLINSNNTTKNYFDWCLDNGVKLFTPIEISSENGINKFIASKDI